MLRDHELDGLSDDCVCVIIHSGAFVPYTIQIFASTQAGRGNPVSSVVYTRHGGNMIIIIMIIFVS